YLISTRTEQDVRALLTISLHDALPIFGVVDEVDAVVAGGAHEVTDLVVGLLGDPHEAEDDGGCAHPGTGDLDGLHAPILDPAGGSGLRSARRGPGGAGPPASGRPARARCGRRSRRGWRPRPGRARSRPRAAPAWHRRARCRCRRS